MSDNHLIVASSDPPPRVNEGLDITLISALIGVAVGSIAIATFMWKISGYFHHINQCAETLEDNFKKFQEELLRLRKKYDNLHFFLIRVHGSEIVDKNLRKEED